MYTVIFLYVGVIVAAIIASVIGVIRHTINAESARAFIIGVIALASMGLTIYQIIKGWMFS